MDEYIKKNLSHALHGDIIASTFSKNPSYAPVLYKQHGTQLTSAVAGLAVLHTESKGREMMVQAELLNQRHKTGCT